MTATLAAELDTRAAHMARVRSEYERVKNDHELEDGCDDCQTGLNPDWPHGWAFDPTSNILLCGPCMKSLMQSERQMFPVAKPVVAKIKPSGKCVAGHKMTAENTYVYVHPSGRTYNRCRACGRRRNKEARAKGKAAS